MTDTFEPYNYTRSTDGTYDTFLIHDDAGEVIASLGFWDEPDTDEAQRAEASARLIVKHLNHWAIDPEPELGPVTEFDEMLNEPME